MNSQSSKQKQEMVTELSSLLHNEWRSSRKRENGSSEPKIEKTKDKEWIKIHGKNDVDIADISFAGLPEDWKNKNKVAAEIAMNEIFKAVENGRNLDEAFIEEASAVIHDQWLERSGKQIPIKQKKPFKNLAEDEKEKDRVQIRKAIKIFQSYK